MTKQGYGDKKGSALRIMNEASQPHDFHEVIGKIMEACGYQEKEASARSLYNYIYKMRNELPEGQVLRPDFILAKPSNRKPRIPKSESRGTPERLEAIKEAHRRFKSKEAITQKIEEMAKNGTHHQTLEDA